MSRPLRRFLTATVATAVATAVFAPTASAGILTASAQCDDPPLVKPFTPWNDNANYRLVPGGTFEPGVQGWQLSRGAKIVSGNESFKVNRSSDSRSLMLPMGSSATSPTVCVGLGEPTLRLFARRNSGLLTTLYVEVLVETSLGLVVPLPVVPGDVGGTKWHPTLAMPIVANLLPLLPGDRTPVRFRFSPLLLGSWQIDDVYVDPFRMR